MVPRSIATTIFLTVLLLFISMGHAQLGPRDGDELTPVELDRVKVGDRAPDFTLEDSEGEKISLSQFHNNKKLVLVFYRGHW